MIEHYSNCNTSLNIRLFRYKCGSCRIKFLSKGALRKHESQYHPDSAFECDLCLRKFGTIRRIATHMTNVHKLNKPDEVLVKYKMFKCGACEYSFRTRSRLKLHRRLVHLNESQFLCELCPASFKNRKNYYHHVTKAHQVKIENRETTICRFCNKTVTNYFAREKHEVACSLKQRKMLNSSIDEDNDLSQPSQPSPSSTKFAEVHENFVAAFEENESFGEDSEDEKQNLPVAPTKEENLEASVEFVEVKEEPAETKILDFVECKASIEGECLDDITPNIIDNLPSTDLQLKHESSSESEDENLSLPPSSPISTEATNPPNNESSAEEITEIVEPVKQTFINKSSLRERPEERKRRLIEERMQRTRQRNSAKAEKRLKERERRLKSRAALTGEALEMLRKRDAERSALKRATMSRKSSAYERKRNAERTRLKRATMSPEAKAAYRKRHAEQQRLRVARLSPESAAAYKKRKKESRQRMDAQRAQSKAALPKKVPESKEKQVQLKAEKLAILKQQNDEKLSRLRALFNLQNSDDSRKIDYLKQSILLVRETPEQAAIRRNNELARKAELQAAKLKTPGIQDLQPTRPQTVFKIACKMCGERFDSKDEFAQHFRSTHVGQPIGNARLNPLVIVKDVRNKRGEINALDPIDDGDSEDTEGEPDNVDEDELKSMFGAKTLNKFAKVHECRICNQEFKTSLLLRTHCIQDHRIKKLKCNKCNHSFNRVEQFEVHWSRRHAAEFGDESCHLRNYPIPDENVKCSHCGKVSTTWRFLEIHINLMHNPNRELHICDQCGKLYKDANSLKRHVEKHHSNEVLSTTRGRSRGTHEHVCRDCNASFIGLRELSKHHWRDHLHVKTVAKQKYQCLICQEPIMSMFGAKRHFSKVHQNGEKMMRHCQECDTQFQRYNDFVWHVRVDHEFSTICLVCGASLRSATELTEHSRIHRKLAEHEKHLICDLCPYRAGQKKILAGHMVKVHGATKAPFEATCDKCGAFYKSQIGFYMHQREKCYRKIGRFPCNYCDKSYLQEANLRHHQEKHFYPTDSKCKTSSNTSFVSYQTHVKKEN